MYLEECMQGRGDLLLCSQPHQISWGIEHQPSSDDSVIPPTDPSVGHDTSRPGREGGASRLQDTKPRTQHAIPDFGVMS